MDRTKIKRIETPLRKKIINGTILTNDPSLTAWGWSVLTWQGGILDYGCIKTESQGKIKKIRAGDHLVKRIQEITEILKSIIETYNVKYILSELPHGSQNAHAAQMIGTVPGILQTISTFLEIGVEWYSEGDVKKHLFNRQDVAKSEMIEKIQSLIKITLPKEKYKREAIADSLGIYLTAKDQSPALKLMKQ